MSKSETKSMLEVVKLVKHIIATNVNEFGTDQLNDYLKTLVVEAPIVSQAYLQLKVECERLKQANHKLETINDILEEKYKELKSYLPKVPSEPYVKNLARENAELKAECEKLKTEYFDKAKELEKGSLEFSNKMIEKITALTAANNHFRTALAHKVSEDHSQLFKALAESDTKMLPTEVPHLLETIETLTEANKTLTLENQALSLMNSEFRDALEFYSSTPIGFKKVTKEIFEYDENSAPNLFGTRAKAVLQKHSAGKGEV